MAFDNHEPKTHIYTFKLRARIEVPENGGDVANAGDAYAVARDIIAKHSNPYGAFTKALIASPDVSEVEVLENSLEYYGTSDQLESQFIVVVSLLRGTKPAHTHHVRAHSFEHAAIEAAKLFDQAVDFYKPVELLEIEQGLRVDKNIRVFIIDEGLRCEVTKVR